MPKTHHLEQAALAGEPLKFVTIERHSRLDWRAVYHTPGDGMDTETTHLTRSGAQRAGKRWLNQSTLIVRHMVAE